MSSGEQFARVGEIDLCYETFGSERDPALLLVMGLGTQMILWDERFCEELAGRGFFVVRFDNRDVGRSTILRHARCPGRSSSSSATSAPPPTRSTRWPPTRSACSTTS